MTWNHKQFQWLLFYHRWNIFANLSYYEEIMGMDFCLSMDFISLSLKKWLPRMNDKQRTYVADSLYNSLTFDIYVNSFLS